jgi:hypothetical protein
MHRTTQQYLPTKDYSLKRLRTTLAVFLFTALPLIAQDTTKPFYFPHKTGDMWEYRFSEYGDPFSSFDTIQVFTISDSIDSNGIIHLVQYARAINPTKPTFFFFDTTSYWIDTARYYVYGSSASGPGYDSVLLYKLNAGTGDQWITKQYQNGSYEMARVTDKWEGTILGKATTLMRIHYYLPGPNTDTSGLDRYYDIIADGFGLVYEGGIEASTMEINLKGAIINEILYGDTTLVSVKNNNNLLLLDIKLYQNFPNPFNPKTVISYQLPVMTKISLKVFNVLGQEVATLFEGVRSAGHYEARFDGSGLASGIYFYRLNANQKALTRAMILTK